jgi:tetratricopeptide (TPR) repeat protein
LPREVAPHGVPEAERGYLLDPLEGYPGAAKSAAVAERRERIARVQRELVEGADPASIEAARSLASDLAAGDPEFPPAKVLASEADFVAGERKGIVARLLPVGDALPTYTASQMLLGRTAELAGDLPLAYSAYRAVAAKSSLALRRTGELHPRVIEIVGNRLHEALKDKRLDDAGRELTLLLAWAPAETATYEASRAVAVARGDRRAELAAIKSLAGRRPGDRDLLERRSDLELQVGDPAVGLKIIQGLADQNPKDEPIAARLAAAKFLWRLSLLPAKVRDIASKPDLTRADFAVLLYWLIPEVRYGKPSEGRIATDVLDQPQREEIVRVVNLGLLDVDETLHRFSPGSPVRRGTALRSVVRLLSRFVTPQPACLGDLRSPCEAARRCGFVPEGEDCQSNDPFSGEDAVELLRRALALLGRA